MPGSRTVPSLIRAVACVEVSYSAAAAVAARRSFVNSICNARVSLCAADVRQLSVKPQLRQAVLLLTSAVTSQRSPLVEINGLA